jgi:hypothetical protein
MKHNWTHSDSKDPSVITQFRCLDCGVYKRTRRDVDLAYQGSPAITEFKKGSSWKQHDGTPECKGKTI